MLHSAGPWPATATVRMAASSTAPDSPPADRLAPPVNRRPETPRAARDAGVAFAGLFVASLVLLRNHPAAGNTAAEFHHCYLRKDSGSVALVGVYLAPFSGIAFLWFIAAVGNLIRDREDRFFGTVSNSSRRQEPAAGALTASPLRQLTLLAIQTPVRPPRRCWLRCIQAQRRSCRAPAAHSSFQDGAHVAEFRRRRPAQADPLLS
jgi:hypothetical protein